MKKFLTVLASLALITTTASGVVGCGQTEPLARNHQQVPPTDSKPEEAQDVILDDNQMLNFLLYQVAAYFEAHPDFRNTENDNDPNNKVDQVLP